MSASNHPIRILHVDDDPDFTALVEEFLIRDDDRFDIHTEPSAEAGIERLDELACDCVVSDYDMPGMDGIELLRHVRETDPELPFILYTGKGSEAVASEAISAGVTDYLQKGSGTEQYELLSNRLLNAVEQYRTNRALEGYRSRIEFTLDVTDSVVFEMDLDTDTEFRHGPFERLYGLPSDSVPDQRTFLRRCVHPEDRESVESLQRSSELPEGATVEQEFRTHPDRGPVRWIHSELYVDTGATGAPRRLIGLDTDITDRKRNEQRLERQNHRLEQLAGVVSHDLRTPLTVATGELALAREERDSPELAAAAEALDRTETLVEDLLTLTRTGTKRQDTDVIDLSELVDASLKSVQTDGATVRSEAANRIRADRSRLKQVFENLLRNAIDHGGETVTVVVGDLPDGFYVADDGPGIPKEQRDAVFEAGYSTAETGTGLGLNIVREIARAHGWTVTVTDSESGGARFEFTGVDVLGE